MSPIRFLCQGYLVFEMHWSLFGKIGGAGLLLSAGACTDDGKIVGSNPDAPTGPTESTNTSSTETVQTGGVNGSGGNANGGNGDANASSGGGTQTQGDTSAGGTSN